jgi:hypothetical protein
VQLERRLIGRLKTANIRFTDAQVERIWAIVSAHQAGLSIRKIAGATGLSSSRIHQLLNAPEAKEIPVWLSRLRQSSRGSGGKKKAERPEPETEIQSRLAREVEVLRRCTDWLQRLERGENVVVNLRLDEGVSPTKVRKVPQKSSRSPHAGPHLGTPYRPIRVTGVGRPQGSFCFRGPISAESVRRRGPWTSGRSASDGGTNAGAAAA